MSEHLKKLIKGLKGTVLTVCLTDNYLSLIEKNDKLEVYKLERLKVKDKRKKIKLKKLKKEFSSKLDYMVCDINGINIYFKRIIYNTYNLIGKKIIYYGTYDEYDIDRLILKYQRFNCKCVKNIYKDGFVLEIDTKNINVCKLFIYKIKDFFSDLVEGIGNLLIS